MDIKKTTPQRSKKDSLLAVQRPDSLPISPDSAALVKSDSAILVAKDSLQLAKNAAIARQQKDSADQAKKDSAVRRLEMYTARLHGLLKNNRMLHSSGTPLGMSSQLRRASNSDYFFYLLAAIATLLGFFRFFYTRYFNNLFRVFFNASLRQSQLTDQLLQAKLPSLFFNIVFVLTGGFYIYLLLVFYHWVSPNDFWLVLLYCTLSLAVIYLVKFITVKFTGWLTGYREVTNTYVFIIFLITKILGILLLPFTVIIAFAAPAIATGAIIISLLLTGLMFLLRFFRSYGLLEHKLKISRWHFFMYVAGIEILPVLLIYKGLVLLLGKNL